MNSNEPAFEDLKKFIIENGGPENIDLQMCNPEIYLKDIIAVPDNKLIEIYPENIKYGKMMIKESLFY